MRCLRSGVKCNGYDDPTLFLDEGPKVKAQVMRRAQVSRRTPPQPQLSTQKIHLPPDDYCVMFMMTRFAVGAPDDR
jgi:hypothetical protein